MGTMTPTALGLFSRHVLLIIALIGSVSSTVFLFMALYAAARYKRIARVAAQFAKDFPSAHLPPVTVLKPVHGAEPRLRENLETFFQQDYPDYEIVFGARDARNGALKVIEELRRRYPEVKTRVIFSGPPAWPNAKVFSLDKMIAASSNDYFVISDSDVEVAPDFLRNVIPPMTDPKTGALTCLYRGVPAPGLSSSLEALGMSVEMPSGVMIADMMEGMRFALGAVTVTRRDALQKIGGIRACADYYSDDFLIGNLVWAAGYNVALSHHVVGHVLIPSSFVRSMGHQLRWMTSTRYSRPKGHLGTGLTFATPFGILALAAATGLGHPYWGVALFAAACLNRILQALVVGWGVIGDRRALLYCWLYPLRDLLGFVTWAGSYVRSQFNWRGEIYRFTEGGRIVPQHRPASSAIVDVL
jgi:ceramide glucosyltransferase